MKLKVLKEYNLGVKPRQVRSCDVNLGVEKGMLFVYSESEVIDPCDSYFGHYDKPLHFSMYGEEGQQLWHREMDISLIPGPWFVPFIALDMDKDGVDEIWFVNNISDKPLMVRSRVIERLDARTGETIGRYPFDAENIGYIMLCEAYRYMLFGGYVNGEPVLVAQQGTYKEMYFQCYNADMSLRWTKVIEDGDGPRGAHSVPILDLNNDGIDEFLFGEHLISLDTGEELFCMDKDKWFGHSDVVQPFTDLKTGKRYVYTCRENGNYEGCPRIVMYDTQGNRVWENVYADHTQLNHGHIHLGYTFNSKICNRQISFGTDTTLNIEYYFDAATGEAIDFPFSLKTLRPIDVNGDGFHEFINAEWKDSGICKVHDCDGKLLKYAGGAIIRIGKWYDFKGEQFMTFYRDEQKVRIWGDTEAADSDALLKRYESGFKYFMQKMTGNGYNWLPTIDCAD